MDEKLLPCPFCGSNNLRVFKGMGYRNYIMIKCMDCGVRGGCYLKVENCNQAWNKRVKSDQVAEQVVSEIAAQ
jgi:Lar family restriction alleviation protein